MTGAFARLEWNVVSCCERIRPNSINQLSGKTAGRMVSKCVAYRRLVF
jgi:hypothetical protein